MTGLTASANFPVIAGPYSFTKIGGQDAFISKFQGDAYNHDYAAYFGGSGNDSGNHIDVDPFGDVWVSGITSSGNSSASDSTISTAVSVPATTRSIVESLICDTTGFST